MRKMREAFGGKLQYHFRDCRKRHRIKSPRQIPEIVAQEEDHRAMAPDRIKIDRERPADKPRTHALAP